MWRTLFVATEHQRNVKVAAAAWEKKLQLSKLYKFSSSNYTFHSLGTWAHTSIVFRKTILLDDSMHQRSKRAKNQGFILIGNWYMCVTCADLWKWIDFCYESFRQQVFSVARHSHIWFKLIIALTLMTFVCLYASEYLCVCVCYVLILNFICHISFKRFVSSNQLIVMTLFASHLPFMSQFDNFLTN